MFQRILKRLLKNNVLIMILKIIAAACGMILVTFALCLMKDGEISFVYNAF